MRSRGKVFSTWMFKPQFPESRQCRQAVSGHLREFPKRLHAKLFHKIFANLLDHGNDTAAFLQNPERTRVRLATDVVEDCIVVAKDVFEFPLLVVNNLVGAQAPHVFNVIRADGGRDVRTNLRTQRQFSGSFRPLFLVECVRHHGSGSGATPGEFLTERQ